MGLLSLPAIESSLRRVQREFESINPRLSWQRDPMSDTVVENLLAGYTFVDVLIDWDIDVFAMGKHKYLLELNNIVLCGPDQTMRAEFAQHLKATEEPVLRRAGGWHRRYRGVACPPFERIGLEIGRRPLRAGAR